MLDKISALRAKRAKDTGREGGFTLIELLVVVVIIGILIAIAIPLYLNYQKGAKNKSAASDARNAIAIVEQCYTDGGNTYPAAAGPGTSLTIACTPTAGTAGGGTINISSGNTGQLALHATSGTTDGYVITVKAGTPGDKTYCYDSTVGGSVKETTNGLGATSC